MPLTWSDDELDGLGEALGRRADHHRANAAKGSDGAPTGEAPKGEQTGGTQTPVTVPDETGSPSVDSSPSTDHWWTKTFFGGGS